MLDVKSDIRSNLKNLLKDYSKEDIKFLVDKPENEGFGDYSSNIALVTSKILKKNSFELAQEIVTKLKAESEKLKVVEEVEAVKPGFINFWLSKEYLVSNLKEILDKKDYGSKPQDLSKKVVVEYSSPNIAKPFTIGHLRSTIIGDAIANLLQANGWKVYRDNHLGDWGTQFGKQIAALKYISLKDGRVVTNDRNILKENISIIERSNNKVKILVKLYQDFHKEAEKNLAWEHIARAEFRQLENENEKYESNPESRRVLWKKCIEWSWEEFEKIYQRLGITFTENGGRGFGESNFVIDAEFLAYKELKELKEFKTGEDGAKLVFFPNGQYPPLMLYKNDGSTLYSTRDLATDKWRRQKYGEDIVVINEVGAEQTLYFKQLYKIEEMLGWFKNDQRIHVKHGLYRFKDAKMSTRKGNTIWLEDVLKEAVKRAEKLGSEGQVVAEQVGIGALKWNDLRRTSEQDIIFDWNEILNMQGDSGPYIQYVYVRTQSVFSKVKNEISFARRPLAKLRLAKLEAEETLLLRTIYRFPEVVEEAGEKFAPNLLCNYLFDLAQKFNLFYQKHKILSVSRGVKLNHPRGVQKETQEFRISLTAAVGQIIKNGLHLLGVQAPNKM